MSRRARIALVALGLSLLARPVAAAGPLVERSVLVTGVLLRMPPGRLPAGETERQATGRMHEATRACAAAIVRAGMPQSLFAAYVANPPRFADPVVRSIGTAAEIATFDRCLQRCGLVFHAIRE